MAQVYGPSNQVTITLPANALPMNTIGTYAIEARYPGDALTAPSTGTTTLVVTDKHATATSVGCPANYPFGNAISCTVYSSTTGAYTTETLGKTVTLWANGVQVGSGVMAQVYGPSNQVTIAVTGTDYPVNTAGSYVVEARYPGDSLTAPSSATRSLVVNGLASGVSIASSPAYSATGRPAIFLAAVSGDNPTGVVRVLEGGVVLGTGTVTGGSATIVVNGLSVGQHAITAAYGGDSINAASTSQQILHTVNAAATWMYAYDASGNVNRTMDPNGQSTQRSYDQLGRLSTLTQPSPTAGAPAPVITTTYDAQDNIKQVTDPRNLATTYTVDGLGNRKASASPDAGASSATYDAAGNVLTRTDARGKLTAYTYDDLNRLTQASPATGTPIVYEYDGGANPTPPPNSKGRLTKISDESGSTAYTYDGFGRVLTKTQTVGNGPAAKTFVVGYTWGSSGDTTGKLLAITYPSGSRANFGYNAGGRLASINANSVTPSGTGTDLATTLPVLAGASYNGANDLLGWTWGDASAYQRTFDENGRLTSLPLGNPAGSGAAAGVTRSVSYDNGYGVLGFTHSRAGTPQPALDQGFAYDALDRLVDASVAGNHSGYGYDATGNRSTRVVGSTTYTNGIAATSNRLTQVQSPGPSGTVTNTYVHDPAGNLTQDGAATYAYSDRGRLASATVVAGTVSYLVNGLEQRVLKSGPTALVATGVAYFVYDEQGRLLGQYDANLTPIHETVYFGDTPVAVMKQSGSVGTLQVNLSYVYADQINAPRVITRASDQAIVWRWDAAEAFGATGPDENPSGLGAFRFDQRFPGQVYDAETGNFDNWHRTYRPSTGRYDSSDPIGLAGGINGYSYVGGDPLNAKDPAGLCVLKNAYWTTKPTLSSQDVSYMGVTDIHSPRISGFGTVHMYEATMRASIWLGSRVECIWTCACEDKMTATGTHDMLKKDFRVPVGLNMFTTLFGARGGYALIGTIAASHLVEGIINYGPFYKEALLALRALELAGPAALCNASRPPSD